MINIVCASPTCGKTFAVESLSSKGILCIDSDDVHYLTADKLGFSGSKLFHVYDTDTVELTRSEFKFILEVKQVFRSLLEEDTEYLFCFDPHQVDLYASVLIEMNREFRIQLFTRDFQGYLKHYTDRVDKSEGNPKLFRPVKEEMAVISRLFTYYHEYSFKRNLPITYVSEDSFLLDLLTK